MHLKTFNHGNCILRLEWNLKGALHCHSEDLVMSARIIQHYTHHRKSNFRLGPLIGEYVFVEFMPLCFSQYEITAQSGP